MPVNPLDRAMQEFTRQGIPEWEARQMVSALFAQFDIDKPIGEQYILYITNLLQGNLGVSIFYMNIPVTEIVAEGLSWTVYILSISLTSSFLIGLGIGIALAYYRGSIFDSIMSSISTFFHAVPNYILALFLLFYLAFGARMFPTHSAYSIWVEPGFTWEFISSVLHHSVLPLVSMIVTSFGFWALNMKGSTISVLGEDYVVAAEARGLSKRRVMFSYVGRNAILPLFTSFAISLGYIFGGATLIEQHFSYPGVGRYLLTSINRRDYVLMQGFFLIITFAVVLSNFIADILYSRLDPRVRVE
jgi:peptide/nickel transport system permease protein